MRRAALVLIAMALGCAPAGAATTYTVTRTDDPASPICGPGNCSLRGAVQLATDGDTISLPASSTPYLITQPSPLSLQKSVTVAGASARGTTISGGGTRAIFAIGNPSTPTVTVSGVTVTHGFSSGFGAEAFSVDGGTLNLIDDAVIANTSSSSGNTFGPLGGAPGSTLNLTRTLVANNSATTTGGAGLSAFGGAIAAITTTTITDSTITGNTAAATGAGNTFGGAISIPSPTNVTITNSTIAGNTASGSSSTGGNLYANTSGGSLKLANTIITGGSAVSGVGNNCFFQAGTSTSLGGNIESRNECGLGASELHDTNPLLTALGNHGGPTDVLALMPHSPALRATTACPGVDQRNLPRPSGCTIGAFEPQAPLVTASASPGSVTVGTSATFTATGTSADPSDTFSATWSFSDGGTGSGFSVGHAFAVAGARSGIATVTNNLGLSGTATAALTVLAAPVAPVAPAAPPVAPSITALRLSPPSFRAASTGATIARHHRAAAGTSVTYTLSAAATTSFAVQRSLPGRRARGGSCVAANRHNRRAKACTRLTTLPGVTLRSDPAGALRARFSGRVAGAGLVPGRYRLLLRAVGPTGLNSAPASAGFTIVR